MDGLPQASLEAGQEIADDLDVEESPARAIYEHGSELDYGLSGALEDGTWLRYPHEIEDEANCYEQALYCYAIADAMDLEPRFFEIDEGMAHGFIDVEDPTADERVLIDPFMNLFGAVEYYGDKEVRVKDNSLDSTTIKEYKTIDQMDDLTIRARTEDLREHSLHMLQDGQKFDTRELLDGRAYDKIHYDAEEDSLVRMISFYDEPGFLDRTIELRWSLDDDGEVQEQTTRFSSMESANWTESWGGGDIADVGDDGYDIEDELPDKVKETIAGVVTYQEKSGDDLIHDRNELASFWEDYSDQMESLFSDHSGFIGRSVYSDFDRLTNLEDTDEDRFWQRLDWLRFLEENAPIEVPDDGAVAEQVPAYLEKHRAVLEEMQDVPTDSAVETVLADVQDQRSGDDRRPITELEDEMDAKGLSSAYTDMVDDIRAIMEEDDEAIGPDDIEPLEQYHPLMIIDEDVRDVLMSFVTSLADEDSADIPFAALEFIQPVQGFVGQEHDTEHPRGDITSEWEFDQEEHILTYRAKMEPGKLGRYDSYIEVIHSFDRLGNREDGKRVRMYDSIDATDEEYLFVDVEVDEIDDIDLDTVQDEARQRTARMDIERPLHAPEPSREESLLMKNADAVAFFANFHGSTEDAPRFFTEEQLDSFVHDLEKEYQWVRDAPYTSEAETEFAQEQLEEIQENQDAEDPYLLREQNKLFSLAENGEDATLRGLVQDEFDSPEEQAAQYVKRHFDLVDEQLQSEAYDDRAEEMLGLASEGIRLDLPGPADIRQFAADEEIAPMEDMASALQSRAKSWPQKTEGIRDGLERLDDEFDRYDTGDQGRITAALDGIRLAMQERRRYQGWKEESGDDTVEQIDRFVQDHQDGERNDLMSLVGDTERARTLLDPA
jgi:hypothetical protein